MNIPFCVYGEGDSIESLNADIKAIYDQLRTLTESNIDGFNLHSDLLGDGLEFVEREQVGIEYRPRKLYNSLANTSTSTYFSPKGDGKSPETNYGMELIVDEDNAVGRFCIVDKDALTTQRMSMIPLVTAGTSRYQVNGRIGQFGTSTANNVEIIRNGTADITLDGTDVISGRTIRSDTTNTDDLGTSSVGWKQLYVRTIDTDGDNDLALQRNNVTSLTLGSGNLIFVSDGHNFALDTTTGTSVGNSASEKLSFWGVAPVVQPTAIEDSSEDLAVLTGKFNELLGKLRDVGIIAT